MIGFVQNVILVVVSFDPSFPEFGRILVAVFSLVPVIAGFMGDFLISRYKLVLVGSYISFVLLIPLVMIVVLQPSYYVTLIGKILFLIVIVTIESVRVNLLPFNIDQLIGSSSDELTAVIHWHNVGPVFAVLFLRLSSLLTNISHSLSYVAISVICITAVLVSHSILKHYLDTTPVNTSNPIKLIVRVLCYARKHKYPENRSALTYWEEEAPSRLDLGKEKYGGPFTEEEVEDVKTILRLIPLSIACTLSSAFLIEYVEGINFELYGCRDTFEGIMSLITLYFVIILLHQFLIYPCFDNYVPSMLKRIGVGMVLILAYNLVYVILGLVGYYNFGHMFRCVSAFDQESYLMPHKWLIIKDLFLAVVWYIINVVLVEFLLAQCPKSMRGTVVGLWLSIRLLRSHILLISFLPFLHISSDFVLGRGFYFFLARAVLSVSFFVIFLLLAKRYKLRVRENEINIHQIAENHIVHNIEQEEEERRRRRSDFSESSSGLHTISGTESISSNLQSCSIQAVD